jgi:hypothetical protein
MSNRMLESINVAHALSSAGINIGTTASNVNSTYFSMANYDRIVFAVECCAINAAGTTTSLVIEAMQSTSSANTAGISMAANVTNTTITAINTGNTIEIRADQMNTNAGYYYAGIRVSEPAASHISNCVAIAIRASARYKQVANAMLA